MDVSDRVGAGIQVRVSVWRRIGASSFAAVLLAGAAESISPNETARHTLTPAVNLPEVPNKPACACVCYVVNKRCLLCCSMDT